MSGFGRLARFYDINITHVVFLRKVFVRITKIIRKIIELDHNSNIRYISNHKFTKHRVLMKCCLEKMFELQEELIDSLVTAHDEIHKHLTGALHELSRDHPAGAAANIGRCMQILEASREEANAILDNEEEDDE